MRRLWSIERSGRAGSRGAPPGRRSGRWWRTGLTPAFKNLDDDHATTAARAWRAYLEWFGWYIDDGQRRDSEQLARSLETDLSGPAGEQAVVSDTVKALQQHMKQEPADEFVGAERHRLLPLGPVAAIILVAEGNAVAIEPDEAAA